MTSNVTTNTISYVGVEDNVFHCMNVPNHECTHPLTRAILLYTQNRNVQPKICAIRGCTGERITHSLSCVNMSLMHDIMHGLIELVRTHGRPTIHSYVQWAVIIIMSHGVISHGCRYHDKAHPMIIWFYGLCSSQ